MKFDDQNDQVIGRSITTAVSGMNHLCDGVFVIAGKKKDTAEITLFLGVTFFHPRILFERTLF